jgi:hypothetical protein
MEAARWRTEGGPPPTDIAGLSASKIFSIFQDCLVYLPAILSVPLDTVVIEQEIKAQACEGGESAARTSCRR